MLVQDVFKRLAVNHLSNLSMAEEATGTIRLRDQNKITGYINDALLRIYSRFVLYQRDVLIEQQMHITNYHLDKRYAKNNPDRPATYHPYILDLPNERYQDDAIKILEVFDEYGSALPLNDSDKYGSVFTPYPIILQVPHPKQGRPLAVRYQAAHRKLEYSVLNAEVDIPIVLEAALLSLVASSVYRDMNTQESTVKGQEHFVTFERICAEIDDKDHASITSMSIGKKFEERGFV